MMRSIFDLLLFTDRRFELDEDMSLNIKEPSSLTNTFESDYTCAQCKSRQIFTTQEQNRSGDEGATTWYHCMRCKYKWK